MCLQRLRFTFCRLALCSGLQLVQEPTRDRPNFLVIVADDVQPSAPIPDSIRIEFTRALVPAARGAIFDRDGAAIDPAEFRAIAQGRSRAAAEEADGRELCGLLHTRRERSRDCGAAEQRDELAGLQLIELHSIPASQGRIAGYRIGHGQSAGIRAFDRLAGETATWQRRTKVWRGVTSPARGPKRLRSVKPDNQA